MNNRHFCPIGIDALEDRMVMTAFSTPFSLITQLTSQVNPKFVILTGHTESQINNAITASFNRLGNTLTKGLAAYEKAISKPNADTAAVNARFEAKALAAQDRLNSDLLAISHKLPFGGVNLYPTLEARISGTAGVTDTTTGLTTPSLRTLLVSNFGDGDVQGAKSAIHATQTLIRSDVKDYIHLGVTNGYFKLGRGAFLPALSS